MTKLEQAARQALEALESYSKSDYIKKQHPKRRANGEKAITALREALAEQEKPLYRKVLREMLDAHEQAEQEPVAWKDLTYGNLHHQDFGNSIPLYAAPVRTKDLTDDEIRAIWLKVIDPDGGDEVMALARAVIAADREKNK